MTTRIKRVRGFPDSSWITHFLLYPSILILTLTTIRVILNIQKNSPTYDITLLDNLLVNLAATSALFFLSATMFQGAIKKAAQREFLSLLQDSSISSSIRQSLFTPLTNNNLKETSLIVVRDFNSVSDLFILALSEAKEGDCVSIMNTWIPQLVEIEEFRNAIKHAWRRGSTIRILMVDPHSMAATLRSESVMSDETSNHLLVNSLVIQCLERLNEIAKDIRIEPSSFSNSLEIRLYVTLPSVSIYSIRVSTRPYCLMLVGMFLHGRLAVHGPQLAIMESTGFVATSFDHEFNKVWNASSGNTYKLCNQGGINNVVRQLDLMRSPDPLP